MAKRVICIMVLMFHVGCPPAVLAACGNGMCEILEHEDWNNCCADCPCPIGSQVPNTCNQYSGMCFVGCNTLCVPFRSNGWSCIDIDTRQQGTCRDCICVPDPPPGPECECSMDRSYPLCGASPCAPNEKLQVTRCNRATCPGHNEVSCYPDASCAATTTTSTTSTTTSTTHTTTSTTTSTTSSATTTIPPSACGGYSRLCGRVQRIEDGVAIARMPVEILDRRGVVIGRPETDANGLFHHDTATAAGEGEPFTARLIPAHSEYASGEIRLSTYETPILQLGGRMIRLQFSGCAPRAFLMISHESYTQPTPPAMRLGSRSPEHATGVTDGNGNATLYVKPSLRYFLNLWPAPGYERTGNRDLETATGRTFAPGDQIVVPAALCR